jgi:NAD(P)-dependent dehydrogenase (short-subunit alcohol dehydrogenase family)
MDARASGHERLCVVTGATSGIGYCAAHQLAAQGAKLVLTARDPKRAERTMADLRARGATAVSVHYADLSSIAGMKQAAAEIASANPRIDVLINNAGGIFAERQTTAEGLERTFALNHLSYFVMANLLRPNLAAAANAAGEARVINVASRAHRGEVLDFSDLQSQHRYRWFQAYGRSKLANILFTRALSKRLAGTAVTANCLHPGFVATRFGASNSFLVRSAIKLAMLTAISPEKGAETIVYLATSPDVAKTSGKYFFRCHPLEPDGPALDDRSAETLWAISAKLTGLAV